MGGILPPGKGIFFPVEGTFRLLKEPPFPSKEKFLPVKGIFFPGKGITLPVKGNFFPVKGKFLSERGITLPVEGIFFSGEGKISCCLNQDFKVMWEKQIRQKIPKSAIRNGKGIMIKQKTGERNQCLKQSQVG